MRLDLKLSAVHHLSMSMSLQQTVKILQMTSMEIFEYIANELESNPFLQEMDDVSEDIILPDEINTAIYEQDDPYIHETSGYNGENYSYENFDPAKQNLRDFISEQISLDIVTYPHRQIAFHLLDLLEPSGYLETTYLDILIKMGFNKQDIEFTIEKLQKFDPSGIFARNLCETIKIQLIDKDLYNKSYEILLANLELLARGELVKLIKLCGVSESELSKMIKNIKSVDPKPGSKFNYEISSIIIPDIFITKQENKWLIELNKQNIPKVSVNKVLYKHAKNKMDKEEVKQMMEYFQNANIVVNALEQRGRTILKVASKIVEKQQKFFEKGIMNLLPLTLKDIATELDMHESTISRVTNGKYMATAFGIFEMKYFFSSSVSNEDGENSSSKKIKYLIKLMIENEDKDYVLSDQEISEKLKNDNINVARRTVMKYRESMNIPNSSSRKRNKILQNI